MQNMVALYRERLLPQKGVPVSYQRLAMNLIYSPSGVTRGVPSYCFILTLKFPIYRQT